MLLIEKKIIEDCPITIEREFMLANSKEVEVVDNIDKIYYNWLISPEFAIDRFTFAEYCDMKGCQLIKIKE